MKKNIFITLISALFPFFASGQTSQPQVSNVVFYQNENEVIINYTLTKEADISLYISIDGGNTFSGPLKKASGDIGTSITPGTLKTIKWEATSEVESIVSSSVCFKVVAVKIDYGINLTFINGDTFLMGEEDKYPVTINDFFIGTTEITQKQWFSVMGNNPSFFKGDNLPIENVSFEEVQEFIRKLNAKTGKKYRLPTEAEWEYSSKENNDSYILEECAWIDSNSSNRTHTVGMKQPNLFGIYDMIGNVSEWCSNRDDSYLNNDTKIVRGGSWSSHKRDCSASKRHQADPKKRYINTGFRLAL